ncbi:hypothetical protein MYX77_01940 [Acidobacteriia bacterium AH_259_A11_L15]|nr:hypothetical protein [Acidobacteriia bacterium AH_259_A11_L15]
MVARVYFVKPKMGMAPQFEEAYREHIAWHRAQGDSWTWNTWQIQTGERFGQYMVGTFGHKWSDFDNPSVSLAEDEAHFYATAGQYVESVNSQLVVFLANLSRPPEGFPGEGPWPLSVVLTFHLEGGASIPKFLNAVGKTKAAIEKTNWPSWSFWYVIVSGTEQPAYVLSLPQEDWADLAPADLSFPAMLEKAHGRQDAQSILNTFDKTIKRQYNELFVHRPDLSYVPEGHEEVEVMRYPPPCEEGDKNCPCPLGKRPIPVKRLDPETGNIVGDIVCE